MMSPKQLTLGWHFHLLWAITKTGYAYTRSVWSQNGYSLESSQKHTPRATRLAKHKSYPFLRDNDPGTPVNAYHAWLSTVFGHFFRSNICVRSALRPFFRSFGLFLLIQIFTKKSEYGFAHFNHYAHLVTYVYTLVRINRARITTTSMYVPTRTWILKTEPGYYVNVCRQVYLTICFWPINSVMSPGARFDSIDKCTCGSSSLRNGPINPCDISKCFWPITSSVMARGSILTRFQAVPVFDSERSGCIRFWLLP